jgi:polysaccharide deacetylase 2 family uncharacterized protein YibQ
MRAVGARLERVISAARRDGWIIAIASAPTAPDNGRA